MKPAKLISLFMFVPLFLIFLTFSFFYYLPISSTNEQSEEEIKLQKNKEKTTSKYNNREEKLKNSDNIVFDEEQNSKSKLSKISKEKHFNEVFLSIFSDYEIDSLTHHECIELANEARTILDDEEKKHQLYTELCSKCEALREYDNLSDSELHNLALQDDIGAMHKLVYRNLETSDSLTGIEPLINKTLANGSIAIAGEVSRALYNKAINDATLDDTSKKEIRDRAVMYEAFIQYRIGRLNPELYDGEEANNFKAFIKEREKERENLGLGKYDNFNYPSWPENFQDRCDELDIEHYKLYEEN